MPHPPNAARITQLSGKQLSQCSFALAAAKRFSREARVQQLGLGIAEEAVRGTAMEG